MGERDANATIRVLHMLPDLQMGGGQQLLLRNIVATREHGIEHVVVAVKPMPSGARSMRERYEGVGTPVHELDLRGPWHVPFAVSRLVRIVREVQADLIHTNNTGSDRIFGQLAALRTGTRTVNTHHSEGPGDGPLPGGLGAKAKQVFERFLCRRAITRVVCVSHFVRSSWTKELGRWGIDPSRISVVHPGLDPALFPEVSPEERATIRRELGVDSARPLLINVARLATGKGQSLLAPVMVEVLKASPRAMMLLVGDGPDRGKIEEAFSSHGVSQALRFAGERGDVPRLLGAADLLVFPSFNEGFGLAPLEAMAARIGVVSFRLLSVAEFIDEGVSGELTPLGEVPPLAKAVAKLATDPEKMRAYGLAGRRIVEERFTLAASARKMAEVYRLAAGKQGEGKEDL